MFKTGVKKIRIVAAASLLGLAGMSLPASAHHGHNYVVPLAAAIAFGALIHHGHHRHHYHYHHHHRRHHGYRHHRHHRRHSYSHGGYHKHHRRW